MSTPKSDKHEVKNESTRRKFLTDSAKIATAAGAVVAPSLSLARSAHAFGSDTIKIGLVGCGGRGTLSLIHI